MFENMPQLRVRSEFSYRRVFGPIERVAARIAQLKCPTAALVDDGTWGHVRWMKASKEHGFLPSFGTELAVRQEDGRRPTAWLLAKNTRDFYRFSSAAREKEADVEALFRNNSSGVIRFAGNALSDPKAFDFVDINPASRIAARRSLRLAQETGKPLVVTNDNLYPAPEDFDAFMALIDNEGITNKFIANDDELRRSLPMLTDEQFHDAVMNAFEIGDQLAHDLPTAPIISVEGDFHALVEAGRKRRLELGHLDSWPAEYQARLERELELIAAKSYESYFMVVSDLIDWAKKRMLVGPGRGSSAGSLVCYCLSITEVDPMPHNLIFERFIDVNRNDLPDIDIDFSDSKRDDVFVYLAEKYGRANVARIGNINTLAPRSALAEVCKRLRVPDVRRFDLYNVMIEYSSGDSRYGHALDDTFEQTDVGQAFSRDFAEAARIVGLAEGHAWHSGVHAAGVIVCNDPITEYCTVNADGIAQIDKPDSEALNLLKIDALGLRTLGIIEDAGVVTADDLYALKTDDPAVLSIFDEKKFCGVFQFEGNAQRMVSAQVKATDFRTLDHVTALARPGPLGGGAAGKYIHRKAGREEVEFIHPALEPVLGDTYGVVLYQEQVMRIVREIGKFSWEDTTVIRKAMSGRKGREFFDRKGEEFVAGAATVGIGAETAKEIWNEICTFGAWGMNRAHTCSYALISYWCAWMKRYHPLEYAAACLRRAKDEEQTVAILREMADEGVAYVPFDMELSDVDWSVQDGKLVGGVKNLHGYGPAKAGAFVRARAAGKITEKMREQIAKAHVKFSDLYPIMTAYGDIYRNPEGAGCRPGSIVHRIMELPPSGDVLVIGKVVKKERRDENETVRLQRRDGRRVLGPSIFLDIFISDDSGGPITVRVNRKSFEALGRKAADTLVVDKDVIMVRGRRVPNFNMIQASNIRCLTNPEAI